MTYDYLASSISSISHFYFSPYSTRTDVVTEIYLSVLQFAPQYPSTLHITNTNQSEKVKCRDGSSTWWS